MLEPKNNSYLKIIHLSFRTLLFCGEVVTTGLLSRCMKTLPWVQFVNLYSISEAHDVAYCDLTEWANEDEVTYWFISFFNII